MKKTILITGGTGYIGSHAVVAFEQAGYLVVIIDNLSHSSRDMLQGITKILGYTPDFYEGDMRNQNILETLFQKYNFDGVLHFAGLKAVGESCEKPLEYFDNNIIGSLKLFECMEKYSVKNIIFSSSATVYDASNFLKGHGVEENGQTGQTTNPYGTTKFVLEKVLYDLSEFSYFKVMNLRYFNPIGAHPTGYIGEFPDVRPNNLLPNIMKVASGEGEKLQVFGDDYDTIDGSGVRDYIDVNDLIEGHLIAYQKLEKSDFSSFENFNLGAGKGVSVLQLLDICKTVTGKNIAYEIAPRRTGDIASVYCDASKAKKELGWVAKTSVEESVRNAWNFIQKGGKK